jgi:hypothetical protein
MKTKLLALILLAGGSLFAGSRFSIHVGIGAGPYPAYGYGPYAPYPAYGYYLPAPPPVPVYGYAVPSARPGYAWVPGYWYPRGPRWAWRAGYWTRPPYARARWVKPRYHRGRFFAGYWRR